MKPRPPLGRLRPLIPRTGRGGAMRATPGPSLVWRTRRRRFRPVVSVLRTVSNSLVQYFPLSLALSWPAPARPTAKVRTDRVIVRRDRPGPSQPPSRAAGHLERLVEHVAERTYELTRREVGRIVRLRHLVSVERVSAAGSRPGPRPPEAPHAWASADPRAEAPKQRGRRLPGLPATAPRRAPQALRPAETPPPRRTALFLQGRAAIAASAGRAREMELRRDARRGPLPLVPRQPTQRPEAGRPLQLPPAPRAGRPERAPRLGALDLVWMRVPDPDAAGTGPAESAALIQPAGLAHQPQAWPAASGQRTAAAAAPAPAPMPDMNRLVDEVVRRLDRIARDERMRRGI